LEKGEEDFQKRLRNGYSGQILHKTNKNILSRLRKFLIRQLGENQNTRNDSPYPYMLGDAHFGYLIFHNCLPNFNL